MLCSQVSISQHSHPHTSRWTHTLRLAVALPNVRGLPGPPTAAPAHSVVAQLEAAGPHAPALIRSCLHAAPCPRPRAPRPPSAVHAQGVLAQALPLAVKLLWRPRSSRASLPSWEGLQALSSPAATASSADTGKATGFFSHTVVPGHRESLEEL